MPPLLIDIPQMIDLALGTPEIGVVNFTVLHSLLHAMTEILNIDKYRVEFRGKYGVNVEKLINHIPLQPILTVQEFKLDKSRGQDHKTEQRTLVPKHRDDKYDKILVIRKTEEIDGEQLSVSARARRSVQQPIRIVSQDDFRKLGPKEGSIHDSIGRYLPTNQEVIDSAKGTSESSSNPVCEMWYVLNVTKRLDATEIAIEKLTSMLRDITEEYRKVKNSADRFSAMADVSHLVDKIDMLEKTVHESIGKQSSMPRPVHQDGKTLESKKPSSTSTSSQVVGPATPRGTATRRQGHSFGSIDHKVVDRRSGSGVNVGDTHKEYRRYSDNSEHMGYHYNHVEEMLEDYYELKTEVERLRDLLETLVASPKSVSDFATFGSKTTTSVSGPPQLFPSVSSKGPADLREISRRTELLEMKMDTVEHQIFDLEKELAEIVDRFEDEGRLNGDLNADVAGIADVYARVTAIKADLESTIDRCNFLTAERDQIVENIDGIIKKIENLKKFKVDRDEIDELLAEKADYITLQRKVSLEQFDATKRHLTRGLVEAFDKLSEQGSNWDKAIEEVKSMAINKADREELAPLRKYIDGKVYAMLERLKALATLCRDPEAAGTKNRYLRKVDCISCNQEVIMKMEEPPGIPRGESLGRQSTLKPLLVYELDSIRKQMKDPQSRNLHHFETMTSKSQGPGEGRMKKLANRYCGGSHTVLTAQDRVQRCKFNKNLMSAECFVKTDEGCYYKAMKKECTCLDQCYQSPNLMTSEKSSKTEVKDADFERAPSAPLALDNQSVEIDIIKEVNSVHSSRSELKADIIQGPTSALSSRADVYRPTGGKPHTESGSSSKGQIPTTARLSFHEPRPEGITMTEVSAPAEGKTDQHFEQTIEVNSAGKEAAHSLAQEQQREQHELVSKGGVVLHEDYLDMPMGSMDNPDIIVVNAEFPEQDV